jgi:hypothetical protein
MKDLVLLVPDKNTQFALRGALLRPQSLGIRSLSFEFRPHPGRDGGARTTGVDVLARERTRFAHALLVFDLEGSGADEGQTALDMEQTLDERLHQQWGKHAKTVVVEPEVDIWIWGADNALQQALDWPLAQGIRPWLQAQGFTFDADNKPARPKEALDAMVPVHRQPRSSALYEKITGQISLRRCTDPAFLRLRAALQTWFPAAD